MSEHAYDITHLLDLEVAGPARPAPPAPTIRAVPATKPPVDTLEIALARELQQAAAAHEALVAEYLSGGDVTLGDATWR